MTKKYANLEISCLIQMENDELMELLYKHKDAFSLRDEIGTCPTMEIEIEMIDLHSS